MEIKFLEDRFEEISDKKYLNIIELIINAVKDYPIYELNDTDSYFKEVKKILEADNITLDALEDYISRDPNKGDENNIWVISSLSSLVEAFDLMRLYKIDFKEVLKKIELLSE